MLKTIFKAVAVSAVAAFFCVGCSDKNNGGGEEPGEGGGTKTSYTVTFDPNDGTVSPTSAKTGTDGKLDSLPTPTRDGYTFDGWYTAATGGTAVAAGNVYTANTTIYARWTDKPLTPPDTANPSDTTGGETKSSYTVTFDPNGGTVNPTSDTTGADGKLDSLPTPTRNGYDFDGWYTAQTDGTEVTSGNTYTANTTIYAQWTAVVVNPAGVYTIKFDACGGTVNPKSVNTDAEGVLIGPLPTPTRSGCRFDGWYTSSSTWGTRILVGKMFSENTTIYAQWSVTITFDADGDSTYQATSTFKAGGRLSSLPLPTKSGFIFEGWYTMKTGGNKISLATVFDSSSTIYTQWGDFTLTDDRDGKVYNRIRIETQIWMAENLNYSTTGSRCYGDSLASCAKYGRLYNWTTAMDGKPSSSNSPSGVQGVCPAGWHIPSRNEWSTLVSYVGSSTSGKKLKSTAGWNDYKEKSGNGTDDFGFSALPGGHGNSADKFLNADSSGYWWSATEDSAKYAWNRAMWSYADSTGSMNRYTVTTTNGDGQSFKHYNGSIEKTFLFSVRCVQD